MQRNVGPVVLCDAHHASARNEREEDHPVGRGKLRKSRISLAVAACCAMPLASAQVPPPITFDGSMGPAGNAPGNNGHYLIRAANGTQHGGNLFHSFGVFNVPTGGSANFDGPNSVSNIIGRVTGGQFSSIDGVIRSLIPGANLFLVNPAGILFGPNAALDVTGSFYATSAHYVALGSDGRFNSDPNTASVLTSAPPSAFGFLGPPQPIGIFGSGLTGATARGLVFAGGDITIQNAIVSAPAGSLNFGSLAQAGEIALASGAALPVGAAGGAITVLNSALSASSSGGLPGGRVVIRGGLLTLESSNVGVVNDSAQAAQGVVIEATAELVLRNSAIGAVSSGSGSGGDIGIHAPLVTLEGSGILSTASAAADGGAIDVQASSVVVRDGSRIDSSAISGDSGALRVTAAESITLARGTGNPSVAETGIFSTSAGSGAGGAIALVAPSIGIHDAIVETQANGPGRAGNISLVVDRLTLSESGRISSSAFSAGAAGNVTIVAGDSIVVTGPGDPGRFPGIFSAAFEGGAGGNIAITAPAIEITNAFISADGFGSGPSGAIVIDTARLALAEGGVLSSGSSAPGPGGRVSVTASESVTIKGQNAGGRRSAISGENRGAGEGSEIAITAPLLSIEQGGITAAASGAGSGGGIRIEAERVELLRGAQISSGSAGAGDAGSVTIDAAESITLAGSDAGTPSGVFVRTFGAGNGGTVLLRAPHVVVDGGAVNVNTEGAGAAGDIGIVAERVELRNGALLDSSTSAAGRGGRIDIAASGSITVSGDADHPTAISTTAQGPGSAGGIVIAAPSVILDGGIVTGDASGLGGGGDITIDASRLDIRNAGRVASTASGRGAGGRVIVYAGESATIVGPATLTSGSGIFVVASGAGDSGDISLTTALLDLQGGGVAASTLDAGNAGSIAIAAERVSVTAGGFIDSSSVAPGDAGRIFVDATQAIDVSGMDAQGNSSRISSGSLGRGRGGEVFLRAPAITLDGGIAAVDAFGSGLGGRVFMDTGRLVLTRGGQVSSNALDDATGGTIDIIASESVAIADDQAGLLGAGIFAATGGRGSGGEVRVTAPLLSLDGGTISSTTFGAGPAGRIAVVAEDVIVAGGGLIDSSSIGGVGPAGVISLTGSNAIAVTGRDAGGVASSISSRTDGPGRGGDLLLSAPTFTVDDGVVRADTSGRGQAGRVAIEGDRVIVTGGGVLASGTSGQGDGGTLNVIARESIVVSGGNADSRSRITNSSSGAGNAGGILLRAPDIRIEDTGFVTGNASRSGGAGSIVMRGTTLTMRDGEISTSTSGSGAGGAIDIVQSGSVSLTRSTIKASSTGSGEAGSISIDAGRSLTLNDSTIATESVSADGGNIAIVAIDMLRLTDSRITTSVGTGLGDGGNIFIDPVFVILDSSQIIANAFGGNGGNIDIITQALLQSGDSVISASSELGIQGTVEISAPESDLVGSLTPLPGGLFDPSLLLRESCSARAGRAGNSFVGVGYGGLPERPGTLGFGSYVQGGVSAAAQRAPLFALAASFGHACAN